MTGIGCDYAAMRWNHKLTRMVYTSESKSLCILEQLVNVNFSELEGEEYTFIEITIPDEVEVDAIEPSSLPDNWSNHPSPTFLRDIGQQWIDDCNYAILRVPSAITKENNFLINPDHLDVAKITTTNHKFSFDGRLFKDEKH